MSKFGDLLGKVQDAEGHIEQVTGIVRPSAKQNAFANLKKTVAGQPSAATAGEDASPSGPQPEVSSPKSFKFNLNKTTLQSESGGNVPLIPPSAQSGTGAVDSMQETTAPDFSEKEAAKDFQSADQPDQYTDIHVAEFKQALDILKRSIGHKELVADALKNIMVSLKKHSFLSDILLPEDCQLMVAGLRESYGVTIAKKQTKKKKRESNEQDVDAVLDQLADVDLQI